MWQPITKQDIKEDDMLRIHTKNFPSSPVWTWQGTAVHDRDLLLDVGHQLVSPPKWTVTLIERETPDPAPTPDQPALFTEPHQ